MKIIQVISAGAGLSHMGRMLVHTQSGVVMPHAGGTIVLADDGVIYRLDCAEDGTMAWSGIDLPALPDLSKSDPAEVEPAPEVVPPEPDQADVPVAGETPAQTTARRGKRTA